MIRILLLLLSFQVLADDQVTDFRIKRFFVQRAQMMKMEMGERFPSELSDFIGFQYINVTRETLVDNRGSQVDAIGVPGSVTLKAESWLEFIESDINLDLLILHELYRMAGIDDDSYIRSMPLYLEFYSDSDSGRLYCDLNETLFETYYQARDFRVTGRANIGNGPLIINTMSGGGSHRDAYNNALAEGEAKCVEEGFPDGFRVVDTGSIRIGSSNTNGFRRSGAEIRIKVRCLRQSQRRLSRRQRRELLCEKVINCQQLLSQMNANDQINTLTDDYGRCF